MRKFTQHFDKVYVGFAMILYAYSFFFFYSYFARRVWAAANFPFSYVNEDVLTMTYVVVILLIVGFLVGGVSIYLLWKKHILGKVLTHIILWVNLLAGVLMGALVYDIEGRYARLSWYVATWRWMFIVLVIFSVIGLTGLLTRWNVKKKEMESLPE